MFKRLGLSALAIGATLAVALAGGAFSQYPIVGVPADTNCLSFGNNGVCNQYSPAGPLSLTGNELIPADTGLPGSQQPQTTLIPLGLLTNTSQGSFRNTLIGGDFNINAWQRGTTPVSAATPTTATMSADRWFAYSSGNTATVSKQTGAADQLLSAGLLAVQRVNRPSSTDVTPICVGQIVPAKEASHFLGNNAVFSFWAMNGAGMSSTGGAVQVSIAYITAADSATPLTNTDAFAKSTAAGYTAVVTKGNANATNTTIASGVATVALSTTMTRYYVSGIIPTTATSVGVKICYTPVGTGGATDWFEFGNAQLEAAAPTTATQLGITAPGSFARRQTSIENALAFSYSYGLVENTGVFYASPVTCTASGAALIGIEFPTQMRGTPTVTVTAGGFSIQTAAAVTAIGTTTLSAATAQHASLTSAAACTTTLPYQLKGTNTTGLLMFSAEP